jgi:hypothetical protein
VSEIADSEEECRGTFHLVTVLLKGEWNDISGVVFLNDELNPFHTFSSVAGPNVLFQQNIQFL